MPGVTSAQLPDVVAIPLGEPDGAIGPRRDANRPTIRGRERKLSDATTGSDAPDLTIRLGEPEVAMGPRRDANRIAARRRERKLSDDACRADALRSYSHWSR